MCIWHLHKPYACGICIGHMHMEHAYAFLGSLRGEALHKLQQGEMLGGEGEALPPPKRRRRKLVARESFGPVEPMPKRIKKDLKLSKNVVLGTNWVWVGWFDALDGGK